MVLDYSLPVAYLMKQVVLIFPDTATLFDYIFAYEISNAEVNSRELSLTTVLTEEQIVLASTKYSAVLKGRIKLLDNSYILHDDSTIQPLE